MSTASTKTKPIKTAASSQKVTFGDLFETTPDGRVVYYHPDALDSPLELNWYHADYPGEIGKILPVVRKYVEHEMGEEKLTGDTFLAINILTEEATILNV